VEEKMKTFLATLAVVAFITPAFAAGNGHNGGGQRGDRGGHSQIQRGVSDRGAWNRDNRGNQNRAYYNNGRSSDHSYNTRHSYRSYGASRSSSGNYGYQYSGSYPSYGYGYGYPANGALRCSYPDEYRSPYRFGYPRAKAGRCSPPYGYGYGDQYGYRY
jgi:hypothetical protein